MKSILIMISLILSFAAFGQEEATPIKKELTPQELLLKKIEKRRDFQDYKEMRNCVKNSRLGDSISITDLEDKGNVQSEIMRRFSKSIDQNTACLNIISNFANKYQKELEGHINFTFAMKVSQDRLSYEKKFIEAYRKMIQSFQNRQNKKYYKDNIESIIAYQMALSFYYDQEVDVWKKANFTKIFIEKEETSWFTRLIRWLVSKIYMVMIAIVFIFLAREFFFKKK